MLKKGEGRLFRQVLKKTGLSQLFLAAAIALPLVGGVATPPVMAQQTEV